METEGVRENNLSEVQPRTHSLAALSATALGLQPALHLNPAHPALSPRIEQTVTLLRL